MSMQASLKFSFSLVSRALATSCADVLDSWCRRGRWSGERMILVASLPTFFFRSFPGNLSTISRAWITISSLSTDDRVELFRLWEEVKESGENLTASRRLRPKELIRFRVPSKLEEEQITGSHVGRQGTTRARNWTIPEVGNLNASKGASTDFWWPFTLRTPDIMEISVGQPFSSIKVNSDVSTPSSAITSRTNISYGPERYWIK